MIKTWQERLVGNRADTAMQSEIADLREVLLEYKQTCAYLLEANSLLTKKFAALAEDFDELLDESRCRQGRCT